MGLDPLIAVCFGHLVGTVFYFEANVLPLTAEKVHIKLDWPQYALYLVWSNKKMGQRSSPGRVCPAVGGEGPNVLEMTLLSIPVLWPASCPPEQSARSLLAQKGASGSVRQLTLFLRQSTSWRQLVEGGRWQRGVFVLSDLLEKETATADETLLLPLNYCTSTIKQA